MRTELIEIGADTPGQNNVVRALVFDGSGAGPRVYMQAGLHAQELPGLITRRERRFLRRGENVLKILHLA